MRKIQQQKKKQRERRVQQTKHHALMVEHKTKKTEKEKLLKYEREFEASRMSSKEKEAKVDEVINKLQHNMQVLKALEEEYDKEQAQRKLNNEALEADGHKTPQEKFNAIVEKAKKIAEDNEANLVI